MKALKTASWSSLAGIILLTALLIGWALPRLGTNAQASSPSSGEAPSFSKLENLWNSNAEIPEGKWGHELASPAMPDMESMPDNRHH